MLTQNALHSPVCIFKGDSSTTRGVGVCKYIYSLFPLSHTHIHNKAVLAVINIYLKGLH